MSTFTDADFREAVRRFYKETAASRGEVKEVVDEVIDEITEETAAVVYGDDDPFEGLGVTDFDRGVL